MLISVILWKSLLRLELECICNVNIGWSKWKTAHKCDLWAKVVNPDIFYGVPIQPFHASDTEGLWSTSYTTPCINPFWSFMQHLDTICMCLCFPGKPSKLYEKSSPDWAPSLKLKPCDGDKPTRKTLLRWISNTAWHQFSDPLQTSSLHCPNSASCPQFFKEKWEINSKLIYLSKPTERMQNLLGSYYRSLQKYVKTIKCYPQPNPETLISLNTITLMLWH